MLAGHVQPNLLIIILERTDFACFSKQPLGCTQNKIHKKAWSAYTALDLPANTSAADDTPKTMATLFYGLISPHYSPSPNAP